MKRHGYENLEYELRRHHYDQEDIKLYLNNHPHLDQVLQEEILTNLSPRNPQNILDR